MWFSVLTIALFAGIALLIAAPWNRWFARVEWKVVLFFLLLVAAYQSQTLFTTRVDVPANLAFPVAPWNTLGRPSADANTGIVFTELVPWLVSARRSLAAGAMPLWNRAIGCGSPLLANQQTALFHPFTLVGLLLPIGKAFTLAACLRLFTSLFFFFAFLRNHVRAPAAVCGAVAWTFATFNVIWLLFPLGPRRSRSRRALLPSRNSRDDRDRQPSSCSPSPSPSQSSAAIPSRRCGSVSCLERTDSMRVFRGPQRRSLRSLLSR